MSANGSAGNKDWQEAKKYSEEAIPSGGKIN